MQPGGRIRPHRPVADLNNTTINKCTRGRGLERPGDGVAALFLEGDFGRSVSGGYFRHVFFCIVEFSWKKHVRNLFWGNGTENTARRVSSRQL